MENNKKWNLRNIAAIAVTVAFFAFQMYIALIKQFPPMLQSPLHLIFCADFGVCVFPPLTTTTGRRSARSPRPREPRRTPP